MPRLQKNGSFISSAISSISDSTTVDTGGGTFTSNEIDLSNVDTITVQLDVTGNSGSNSSDVTAYFTANVDRDTSNWDTIADTSQAYASLALTMSGSSTQRQSALIDVSGIEKFRLERIDNSSGDSISDVNVHYGYLEQVE